LRSKDENLFEKNKWMFEGESKYLTNDPEAMDGNKIMYSSYPRSGNSFLRKLLE